MAIYNNTILTEKNQIATFIIILTVVSRKKYSMVFSRESHVNSIFLCEKIILNS